MTLRRLPDEDPQNLADPAYRRRRIIMQNMRDEELAIAQVEEMQAVSAVLKGKYTMTGEAFDPVEVDMGRSAANNITQSGGTEWSKRDKSTYDPTDDIEAYALNASGVVNISGDYLRVTDNKGKTHDVLTGSDGGRHSNTSLAWGAGVQFNPTESVAIDLAYEGSGSGDWRTDGFIVGVGYKF